MLSNTIAIFFEPLVASTGCEGLVVPTFTLPKLRFLGLSFRVAFCANASAGAVRSIARRSAKLSAESARTDNFDRGIDTPPLEQRLQRKASLACPINKFCKPE